MTFRPTDKAKAIIHAHMRTLKTHVRNIAINALIESSENQLSSPSSAGDAPKSPFSLKSEYPPRLFCEILERYERSEQVLTSCAECPKKEMGACGAWKLSVK